MQMTQLTNEQQALHEVTRSVLEDESPPSKVRELTEAHESHDPKLWRMAGELGWLGLEVPENRGGSGQTFYEVALVLRELGRATTPGPYLSQSLAIAALNAVPDHALAGKWLERLASGYVIGSVLLGSMDLQGHVHLEIRLRAADRPRGLDEDLGIAVADAVDNFVVHPGMGRVVVARGHFESFAGEQPGPPIRQDRLAELG